MTPIPRHSCSWPGAADVNDGGNRDDGSAHPQVPEVLHCSMNPGYRGVREKMRHRETVMLFLNSHNGPSKPKGASASRFPITQKFNSSRFLPLFQPLLSPGNPL